MKQNSDLRVKQVMLVRMQQLNALRPGCQRVIPKQTRLLQLTRFMQPRIHAPLDVGENSYSFGCLKNVD